MRGNQNKFWLMQKEMEESRRLERSERFLAVREAVPLATLWIGIRGLRARQLVKSLAQIQRFMNVLSVGATTDVPRCAISSHQREHHPFATTVSVFHLNS